MKKLILSVGVVGMYLLYAIHLKQEQADHQIIAPPSLQNPQASFSASPTPTSASSNPPAPTQVTGIYKDGSYIGAAADAFYGSIQVKAIISGGKITDVIFLQYPNDRSTSVEINSQAMPYLKQEAIQVQSANVDIVSGATDSSIAFKQSLGSALSQAKL